MGKTNFCTYRELRQELRKPLKQKVEDTENIIAERLGEFGYRLYVAWSGGKDSTLAVHFARKYLSDVPVVFCNTGVEYPETVAYVRKLAQEWKLNLIETKPLMPFWEVVERYGFPELRSYRYREHAFRGGGKHSHGDVPKCCLYLKEYPVREVVKEHGFRAVMTGITAAESMQRRLLIIRRGYCYSTSRNMPWSIRKIHPLYHWTPQDVLRYYKREGLPLNPVYQKVSRCGCMPCTGHIGWRKQLGKVNPRLLRYVTRRRDGIISLDDF